MPKELKEYSIERPVGTSGKKPKTLAQRIVDFWSYVKKEGHPNGCWEWQAGVLKSGGYGQFNINGEIWRTHVLSWLLKHGSFDHRLVVCHKCDNPICVNPEHLFLGTRGDNMSDMITKGRQKHPSGEEHVLTQLSDADVREIRRLGASGEISKAEIGRQFGVCRSHIGHILAGRSRKTST